MKVSKVRHFGQTGSDSFSPSSGKFTGRCGFIVRSWMTMNPTRKKVSIYQKQFKLKSNLIKAIWIAIWIKLSGLNLRALISSFPNLSKVKMFRSTSWASESMFRLANSTASLSSEVSLKGKISLLSTTPSPPLSSLDFFL